MNNVLLLREISSRRQVQRLGGFLNMYIWGQGTLFVTMDLCLGSLMTGDEKVKNLGNTS